MAEVQGQMKQEAASFVHSINSFITELPGMINKTITDKSKNETEVLEEKAVKPRGKVLVLPRQGLGRLGKAREG